VLVPQHVANVPWWVVFFLLQIPTGMGRIMDEIANQLLRDVALGMHVEDVRCKAA